MTPEATRQADECKRLACRYGESEYADGIADVRVPSERRCAAKQELYAAIEKLASMIPAGGLAEEAHSCKNCANWDVSDSYESAIGLGVCKAVPMFWDSTEWNFDDADKPDGCRRWTADAKDRTAFVQDGSDYKAMLYTKGEHSCSMFAAMAASTPQGKETP